MVSILLYMWHAKLPINLSFIQRLKLILKRLRVIRFLLLFRERLKTYNTFLKTPFFVL